MVWLNERRVSLTNEWWVLDSAGPSSPHYLSHNIVLTFSLRAAIHLNIKMLPFWMQMDGNITLNLQSSSGYSPSGTEN